MNRDHCSSCEHSASPFSGYGSFWWPYRPLRCSERLKDWGASPSRYGKWVRLLLLSLTLAATRLLTTSRGRWVYPVCCLVGGPVAALALSSAATPEAVTLAAFITAVVDVAMLIMWLCYFGYAKIGENPPLQNVGSASAAARVAL